MCGYVISWDERQRVAILGSMKVALEDVKRTLGAETVRLPSWTYGNAVESLKRQSYGPYKLTHRQLELLGVIQRSNVPDNRRGNIYFNFTSPLSGTIVISLHYKGRSRGLLELELKLEDLLEMQKDNQEDLDLEYVQFYVPKTHILLTRLFDWGEERKPL